MEIKINKKLIADSMLQVIGEEAADSRILRGYRSPVESEAILRAKAAGYDLTELCPSGEFAIDLIGESGINGGFTAPNGNFYTLASSYKVAAEDYAAALHLDVNGSPRRAAAQFGLVNIKPTVGTVSGYGCIPVCRSSDTVSVTAKTVTEAKSLLDAITGKDEKDPISTDLKPAEKRIEKIGLALWDGSDWLKEKHSENLHNLSRTGVETVEITESNELFTITHSAWNTILCAELSCNLSRYDGVHFGRRAENISDLNELYIRSRSEGFGKLIKAAILYGAYAVTETENGQLYTKAVKARAYVKSKINELFDDLDAIIIPACSVPAYTVETVKSGRFTALSENFYTALPSLLGLPTVTVSGVQIIGKPHFDDTLIDFAEKMEVVKK